MIGFATFVPSGTRIAEMHLPEIGRRCQAMAVNDNRKVGPFTPTRCESRDTKPHHSRDLCWLHRKAADNAARSQPLEFAE